MSITTLLEDIFPRYNWLRKGMATSDQPEQDKPIHLPNLKDYTPPKFIDWRRSIRMLTRRIDILGRELVKQEGVRFLPAQALCLALVAERETIKRVNDQYLNCAVPWDPTTRFPLVSAIAADTSSHAKTFSSNEQELKAVLESFGGWAVFSHEEIQCACGRGSPTPRSVEYRVMLNHGLRVKGGLLVKQMVGIESSDRGHLMHHYGFRKSSRRVDDLEIIWIQENRIRWEGSRLVIESAPLLPSEETETAHGLVHAETAEFRVEEFVRRIQELLGFEIPRDNSGPGRTPSPETRISSLERHIEKLFRKEHNGKHEYELFKNKHEDSKRK